jgi:glycosyltransferase involved in cell wall biosynthesis
MPESAPMIEHGTRASAEQSPLVSVITPTFNSGRLITRAIRSVQAQTYQNFEIIIADDASKDDTRQQVESLAESRITFLPSTEKTNQGPAATRNRALACARGTFVAFLDSDDEWLPEKLNRQVLYLESHPACSLVVTNAYDISPNGDIVETEFDSSAAVSGPDAWRTLLKYSFIETSSVMTRRSLVEELGAFDPKLFVSQDQDLWIRLAVRGEVGIIDEVLGKIHQVPTGHMTRNRHRQAEIMLPMIEGHIARLREKLSQRDIDDILGHRYQVVGRSLFLHGYYSLGLKLVAKASRRNGNWLGNLYYVCHANPLSITLKRIVGRGSNRA